MVEVFQLILGALASLIASRLEVENLILAANSSTCFAGRYRKD
jgi:hypothetical protein